MRRRLLSRRSPRVGCATSQTVIAAQCVWWRPSAEAATSATCAAAVVRIANPAEARAPSSLHRSDSTSNPSSGARYCPSPICFMNSPLSQNRYSSNMMPSFPQWPMVAIGIR
jgi:hypothetical protein